MANEPQIAGPQTVKQWLDNNEAVVIDVREDEEVARVRIPGTVHIALSRFDPTLIPDLKGRKLVFQCAAGIRSGNIARHLLQNGIVREAVNLDGGIRAWIDNSLPVAR